MSLFHKMLFTCCAIIILVLCGTFFITMDHNIAHLVSQLQNNAENTAQILGLSVQEDLQRDDMPALATKVDTIFNQNYFEKITVTADNGQIVLSRNMPVSTSGVPSWFMKILPLPIHPEQAAIELDSERLGVVTVESGTGLAYHELWATFMNTITWFLETVLVVMVLFYLAIKWLLSPLKKLTQQAQAICNKEFRIEKSLPRTKELRQLMEAMNHMVVKLQTVFNEQLNITEKLRAQAYLDGLTSLGNRKFFNQKIKHLLASEEDFIGGYFSLIEIKDLKSFNDRYGFQKGDELVKTIACVLEQQLPTQKIYLLARIAGATFASVLIDIDEKMVEKISNNILHAIQQHLNAYESMTSVNIGVVAYNFKMTLTQILSGADHALRQSQSHGAFSYAINDNFNIIHNMLTATQWNELILHALNTNSIVIYGQHVKTTNNKNFQQEVYLKIKDSKDKLINAAMFLPEAERFGLAIDLDKLVIKNIINRIKNHPPLTPYAVNLSSASLYDTHFLEWLWLQINALSFNKRVYLHFEVAETIIFNDIAYCEKVFRQLKAAGIKLGVDKVGANFFPIHYMHRLSVNYLKVDGSFSQGIEQDKDKQFFVYNLCQAANTLGVDVIATNVETAIQWEVLQESQIKLGQGFLFEAPQNLEDQEVPWLKVVHG